VRLTSCSKCRDSLLGVARPVSSLRRAEMATMAGSVPRASGACSPRQPNHCDSETVRPRLQLEPQDRSLEALLGRGLCAPRFSFGSDPTRKADGLAPLCWGFWKHGALFADPAGLRKHVEVARDVGPVSLAEMPSQRCSDRHGAARIGLHRQSSEQTGQPHLRLGVNYWRSLLRSLLRRDPDDPPHLR
jgi:hypothetical protein